MNFDGFASAIRTLTIFPMPGHQSEKNYQALPWFVIVGLGIGFVQFLAAEGLTHLPLPLAVFCGLFLAALNYVLTGGLHLDGLADMADAFGTTHSSEKTLDILKDPHIGSFGVGALVLTVIWRIVAYQQLFSLHQVVWIIYALGISRVLQGLILLWFPYSRGSEGKAYGYKGPFWVSIILLLQIVGIVAIIWYKKGPFVALIPLAVGLVILAPIIILPMRRIGGITGDCIGAATELFECVFLTGAIACLR